MTKDATGEAEGREGVPGGVTRSSRKEEAGPAVPTAPGQGWIARLRSLLLDFYGERARDLPWRATDDPYAIWVSEVMSQQTRVETVIPYWTDWLERYPTVRELATAPEEDVLKSWEGLGYYSRARNLHRAAKLVRDEHGGRLPDSLEGLRSLPGVGDYTAGAVGSIAFGLREPAVDGNVRRVAARLLDWPDPSGAPLRREVTTWVPAEDPGTFNQALMELGATVCTPRSPACTLCPVAELCAARAAGTVGERPVPRKRSAVRRETRIVTVDVAVPDAAQGDTTGESPRFRLRRRPAQGLLGGMFEFPSTLAHGDDGADEGVGADGDDGDDRGHGAGGEHADRRAPGEGGVGDARSGGRKGGVPGGTPGRPLDPVPHQFSHLHVTYRPFLRIHRSFQANPESDPGTTPDSDTSWYTLAEIGDLPLPVAQQAILQAALDALAYPDLAPDA